MDASKIRDVCQLLGGLALDGANLQLLQRIHHDGAADELAGRVEGPLGEALRGLSGGTESTEQLAAEFTRLTLIGPKARGRPPIPPIEDAWSEGTSRKLVGDRSLAVMKAYAAASLGFDGMKGEPSDHIGLELCFVAALADEESQGARDSSARDQFVKDHLAGFAPRFGGALREQSTMAFWRAVGAALVELPRWLRPTSLRVSA